MVACLCISKKTASPSGKYESLLVGITSFSKYLEPGFLSGGEERKDLLRIRVESLRKNHYLISLISTLCSLCPFPGSWILLNSQLWRWYLLYPALGISSHNRSYFPPLSLQFPPNSLPFLTFHWYRSSFTTRYLKAHECTSSSYKLAGKTKDTQLHLNSR